MSPAEARVLVDEEEEKPLTTHREPKPVMLSKNTLLGIGAGTLASLLFGAFKLGILWNQTETTLMDHEKRIAAVEKMQMDVAAMRNMVALLVEEKKTK